MAPLLSLALLLLWTRTERRDASVASCLCSMCCAAPGDAPCALPEQQSLLMGELLQLLRKPQGLLGDGAGLCQAVGRRWDALCSMLGVAGTASPQLCTGRESQVQVSVSPTALLVTPGCPS